jgi:signal peptidase I
MRVKGDSMAPTFLAGDVLLTWPLFSRLKQGQCVVFRDPIDQQLVIKRVAGLPGQVAKNRFQGNPAEVETHTVEWGYSETGGQELPSDHYFLLGDNSSVSIDSRQFGTVSRDRIDRRVLGRVWPLFRQEGQGD